MEAEAHLGVSLLVQAPTGSMTSRLLLNIGTNRWAIKPEVGYSERHGKWLTDVYGSVWFFTKNPEFFSHNRFVPGTQSKTQEPIEVVEGHLSYDFKPRLWVSLDGNFWYGGRSSINGVENRATLQKNSRLERQRQSLSPGASRLSSVTTAAHSSASAGNSNLCRWRGSTAGQAGGCRKDDATRICGIRVDGRRFSGGSAEGVDLEAPSSKTAQQPNLGRSGC